MFLCVLIAILICTIYGSNNVSFNEVFNIIKHFIKYFWCLTVMKKTLVKWIIFVLNHWHIKLRPDENYIFLGHKIYVTSQNYTY